MAEQCPDASTQDNIELGQELVAGLPIAGPTTSHLTTLSDVLGEVELICGRQRDPMPVTPRTVREVELRCPGCGTNVQRAADVGIVAPIGQRRRVRVARQQGRIASGHLEADGNEPVPELARYLTLDRRRTGRKGEIVRRRHAVWRIYEAIKTELTGDGDGGGDPDLEVHALRCQRRGE